MTYDPRFNKIVYTPVEEMKHLRSSTPIDSVHNGGWSTTLKVNGRAPPRAASAASAASVDSVDSVVSVDSVDSVDSVQNV
jgi:hypothetical protein